MAGQALTFAAVVAAMAAAIVLLAANLRRLRRRLAAAEARILRTQLNPHFLYNTLNAISELGYNDPETADRVVTQLSQLLRKSLDDSDRTEIALRAEVAFLERYLNIQRILLRERLQIGLDIEAEALNARVPGMVVQPLAENALTHGISGDGIARLRVHAARQGENLVIEVQDAGPGMSGGGTGRGIGLSNIRARLKHLYGHAAALALLPAPGGGLIARLVIPFHESYAYSEAPRPDR
jgi:two-component system, LytTR family, sensor kinase